MKKNITRRYINKKGELIEKHYEYDSSRYKYDYTNSRKRKKRGTTIVTKSGKINWELANTVLDTLDDTDRLEAEFYIKTKSQENKRRGRYVNAVTVASLNSHIISDQKMQFLYNAGIDINDSKYFEDELDTTIEDYLDDRNWTNDEFGNTIFTNKSGIKFMAQFSYEDTVWRRI